jgi:hypothetical protein
LTPDITEAVIRQAGTREMVADGTLDKALADFRPGSGVDR